MAAQGAEFRKKRSDYSYRDGSTYKVEYGKTWPGRSPKSAADNDEKGRYYIFDSIFMNDSRFNGSKGIFHDKNDSRVESFSVK